MKLKIVQKVGLLIVGLILITFFIQFMVYSLVRYRKKYEKIQEGMTGVQKLEKGITGAFTSIGKTFTNVGKILEEIALLPIEMTHLVEGIYSEFKCGLSEFDDGFKYGWETFAIIISCCWDKLKKIGNGKCIFYYFIDIIWGVFYGILIMLPISIIDAIFGIDLQIIIKLLYDIFIAPIDDIIFSIFGFHIFRWSDSVIKDCYRCTGTINGRTITKTVDEWAQLFNCSNSEITDGFHKMLEAIVPNKMWGQWFQGKNLNI